MRDIDLHGLTENEAILEVNAALWALAENELDQIVFITGNGAVLKNLVIDLAWEQGFNYRVTKHNPGIVIVFGK